MTSNTISDGDEGYFPLTLGSKWTYEWADRKSGFPSTDVYEVTGIEGSHYYISHYYYALKQTQA